MTRLYSTLLLVLLAVGVAGLVFWRYFYQATISIDPLPTDATITVDGKAVADRTLHVNRGDYEISVNAPGYRGQNFTAKVGVGSQVNKRVELVALPHPTQALAGPLRFVTPSTDRKTLYFEKETVLNSYALGLSQALPAVPISPKLADLTDVRWSPDFSLALMRKSSGEIGLYDFHKYDLLHQQYRVLDAGLKDAVWSADGSSILADYRPASGEHSLVSLNRAGQSLTRLFDLKAVQFPLANPKLTAGPGNLLILSPDGVDGDIYLFDGFQKTPPVALTDSGRASNPILSPDRSKLAYLDNGELVASEIDGKNKRNLAVRPRPGNYSFIDGVRVAVFLPNAIQVIDISDGSSKTSEIFAPSDVLESLFADPDGKAVYYVYQGNLFRIQF